MWCRAAAGCGKCAEGARALYFNEASGRIWLLMVYTKNEFDNLPASFLAQLKHEVEDGRS